jgi:DNA-binding LacI/PurR family transcriptional regulator
MALKDLSLKDVSRRSGVPYQQCSEILNGTRIHTTKADRIRRAIESAPTPREMAA